MAYLAMFKSTSLDYSNMAWRDAFVCCLLHPIRHTSKNVLRRTIAFRLSSPASATELSNPLTSHETPEIAFFTDIPAGLH